jgi:hypothetical protein
MGSVMYKPIICLLFNFLTNIRALFFHLYQSVNKIIFIKNKKLWYFVLHGTEIYLYICIANNNVIKSSFFKKVLC